ncbi:Tellurite resistance protein TehA [Singulisphaera sp. GP187]|uniref:tellurite resistance/C4-dicarboxylate transporter family protein n=1 Tax=Singulisphaera sp. GP187 TaxID=1882752 RepID=UPI00092A03DC|nr:tellurite resistance/C4-dicarboxylate transporter family protein [Singulisphaera sp. GP187]SIN82651.1 Tellurite resistance protein TehA [Singulisphaera sp. GP187]
MSTRNLPPSIFAIVMATGIVAIAAKGAGMPAVAWPLFGLNVLLYPLLWGLLITRCRWHHDAVRDDLRSHAKAPGFFTIVAATCILGNQFVTLGVSPSAGLWLWVAGVGFWVGLTYTVLPWLMEQEEKPPLEKGISGAWLVTVVGTQAVSVLGTFVVDDLPAGWGPFIPLCFWLVGGMLYVWLISLIFYRIVFLPLAPGDLTPPYWINMGAMAISTLAGARVAGLADRSPLVAELLPFIKGGTLLFWATASWWIPVLLTLGAWRHLRRKFPLQYDHGYWSAVFPLGMYTVATKTMADSLGLPFLAPIPAVFVWVALIAWAVTFGGLLVNQLGRFRFDGTPRTGPKTN